jgi:hypothetical protein
MAPIGMAILYSLIEINAENDQVATFAGIFIINKQYCAANYS